MLRTKAAERLAAALMAVAAALCLLAVLFAGQLEEAFGADGLSMAYETALFDTDTVMTVDISMDADDWQEMLDTATEEEYYECDVTINGETCYRVGIRPKGNTSRTAIASSDSDRFSFKLEFDQYVDGQTFQGLDKMVLNNNYADATNMKEALVYDMFQFLGADASLYNYAEVSVNGEYWGVYLAIEAVEDSFLLRSYGTENGALYKPDSMNFGDGGGFSMGGGGADLNYIDDDLDSYSTIWDGSVTDTADGDHRRVVEALRKVHAGEDIEAVMDVDNLLRYMAVQSFVVNEDSFTGNMAHNYYLYESGGQLNVIPWDYNLSFGGMGMGDAESLVNDPIDSPFSGTDFFDVLLEDEEYRAQYHAYYRQLVEEYLLGGVFDETYTRIRSQIDQLVETDPNALFTYDEYLEAADMLYQTITLRTESVLGQLDGTIPSTDEGQREDDSALVDASSIDLSVMGTMMGGGGFGGFGGGDMEPPEDAAPASFTGGAESSAESGAASDTDGASETPPSMPEETSGGEPAETSGETAEPADGQHAPEMPEDFDFSDFDFSDFAGGGFSPSKGGGGPGGFGGPGGSGGSGSSTLAGAVWCGGCLVLMAAALIAVWRFRRRPGKKRRKARQHRA